MNTDTIYSLVTAPINQNIAIIRISGSDSKKIFTIITNIKETEIIGNKAYNKNVLVNNKIIDNALFIFFRNPNSFTGEDVLEIQTHGNLIVINKIIKLLEKLNLRQAEPGEFSRRAYLNNKINLMQAEAINSLIFANSEIVQNTSSDLLSGKTSSNLKDIRDDILSIIATIEMSVDYPEFDESRKVTDKKIKQELNKINKNLSSTFDNSNKLSTIENGIKIAIVGKPNVGKSSLLNAILKKEKAIVFDMPGTTRDIVEGEFYMDGLTYKIIDTAGIRKTNEAVESIGINIAIKQISQADIVLVIIDNSKKVSKQDLSIIDKAKNKNHIIVLNKTDLNKNLNEYKNSVKISAKNNDINELIKAIKKETRNIIPKSTNNLLLGERQINLIEKTVTLLNNIIDSISQTPVLDLIVEDLKEIYNLLGEAVGEKVDINILDKIFSKFCLGK